MIMIYFLAVMKPTNVRLEDGSYCLACTSELRWTILPNIKQWDAGVRNGGNIAQIIYERSLYINGRDVRSNY